jgi:hypothetical protein
MIPGTAMLKSLGGTENLAVRALGSAPPASPPGILTRQSTTGVRPLKCLRARALAACDFRFTAHAAGHLVRFPFGLVLGEKSGAVIEPFRGRIASRSAPIGNLIMPAS